MRDSGAFDEFFTATAPRIVAQVYAMIGDLAEAEDAVQEAFARAWARWSPGDRLVAKRGQGAPEPRPPGTPSALPTPTPHPE